MLRLGDGVRPVHYALDLEVDPDGDVGTRGSAAIELQLDRPRRTIWLHARDLHATSASVAPASGDAIPGELRQVDDDGLARLDLAREVGPGRAILHLAWEAPWGPTTGAYRFRSGGRAYAVTQFEPIDARRAFPCFDDPAFKTPFDVTLRVPEGAVAVGNAPVVETAPDGPGRARVRFATTAPLPTYLVFWAVGPFDVVTPPPLPANDVRARPLAIRAIAPRGRGDDAAFLLETTGWVVPALERYFGMAFPYEKLDQLAIPDFAFGGMENAGAIAYAEAVVLLDPRVAAAAERRGGAEIIAHEIAHQWFGDLVTMRWWDEIWLNESFATWMERIVLQDAAPGLRGDLEAMTRTERAMDADSLASARAIRQPVERASAILDQFDRLSYDKGAAVLSMFERFAGAERFRAGIRDYLGPRRDGTGSSADLLATLSRATGTELAAPFQTFLDRPGVPLVEAASTCTAGGARLTLRQSRYLPLASDASRDVRWTVPVCVRLGVRGGEARQRCVLLADATATLELPEGCPEWVFPNADGAGYYRWAMPADDVARLRERGVARLTDAERISWARGLAAALRAGTMPWSAVMASHAALAADPVTEVVLAGIALTRAAHEDVVPPEARGAVEAWARRTYGPLLRRLTLRGRPGDGVGEHRLRTGVVELLALTARDAALRRELARAGGAYLGAGGAALRPEAADPDVADVALAVAIQEGGLPVFELALARTRASTDAAMRERLLRAIARVEDEDLSERVLALTHDAALPPSERFRLLAWRSHTPAGRSQVLAAFERDPDAVLSTFPPTLAGWSPHLFDALCDAAAVERVRAPFEARRDRLPETARSLAETIETIRLCAAVRAANARPATRWFEAAVHR